MTSTKSTGSDPFCHATRYCSRDQLNASAGTRGDYLASGLLQRENFFANRAVNEWNKLPATATSAETLNHFKNQYDKWKVSGSPA